MDFTQNKEYKSKVNAWRRIKAFLTGEGTEKFMIQGLFEQDERYKRRKQMADFQPLTRAIIGRLTGMVFNTSADIVYEGVDVIPSTFWDAAGTREQDFRLQMHTLLTKLLAYNSCSVIVKSGPEPKIEVVDPLQVPRWNGDDVVVVKAQREKETSILEDQETETVYIAYYPDRWEMIRVDKKSGDKNFVVVDSDDYGHTFTIDGRSVSPALRVSMDWPVSLGAEISKTHKAIYQMESAVDSGTMEAIKSSTIQAAVGGDEEAAEEFVVALKKGKPYVPYDKDRGEHKPLSLPTGPLEQGVGTLKRKRKALEQTLGIVLNENSQSQSATEANIKAKSGLEATLSMAATVMESVETNVLRRVAQASNTNLTDRQISAISVTYPRDFMSERTDEEGEE